MSAGGLEIPDDAWRGSDAAPCVAVIFDNFGPYHLARLQAASRRMRIAAIELAGGSDEYRWQTDGGAHGFARTTLFAEGTSTQRSAREIDTAMVAALDRIRPDAIAIPGWADRGGLSALRWGRKSGVPVIVMSASNAFDHRRFWLRERIKRWIVAQCSAGIAGGTQGAAYLEALGLPRDRVHVGYDTVDNDYFARGAQAARHDDAATRHALALPERYFLCSCRFVPKKNLPFLLDAFAAYRRGRGDDAWNLVLVGDGELRPALEAQAAGLALGDGVTFAGFVQYDRLPSYYGLAGCFVLPSTVEQWGLVVNEAMAAGLPVLVSARCGCATDLVEDGANGMRFDPADQASLIRGFESIAHGGDVGKMAAASREIIARWSPARFADSLRRAVDASIADRPRRLSGGAEIALRLLMGRK